MRKMPVHPDHVQRPSVKPSRAAQGFTLVELLISMVLLSLLLLLLSTTATTSLRLYRTDQAQVKVNRNARSLFDTLSTDIRQAGENLTADFPAVRITASVGGNSVLSLRRGLMSDPLPVCSVVLANSTQLYVNASTVSSAANYNGTYSSGTATTSGISALQAACATSPVDLTDWQAAVSSGSTSGYLYNLSTDTGAFVTLTAASNNVVTMSSPGTNFQPRALNSSSPVPTIRLYLLEDHTYSLSTSNNMLQLSVNGAAAVPAAPGMTSFVVTPYTDTSTVTTLPFLATPSAIAPSAYGWRDLDHLNITLALTSIQNGRSASRTFSENYLPRNVLSHDD